MSPVVNMLAKGTIVFKLKIYGISAWTTSPKLNLQVISFCFMLTVISTNSPCFIILSFPYFFLVSFPSTLVKTAGTLNLNLIKFYHLEEWRSSLFFWSIIPTSMQQARLPSFLAREYFTVRLWVPSWGRT